MKVVYMDVENNKLPKVMDIEDKLEVFYELIGCRCIDIVRRKIGNKRYDVICDDEGLFKDDPVVSAVDTKYGDRLVGNLIICKSDVEGNLMGLSDNDVEEIIRHIKVYFTQDFEKICPVLQMTY